MKKTYRKDLLQSVTASKGRFVSILTLMMMGSLALVGLKVASPNMERTAEDYLRKANTFQYGERSGCLHGKTCCFWGSPKCNGYPSL